MSDRIVSDLLAEREDAKRTIREATKAKVGLRRERDALRQIVEQVRQAASKALVEEGGFIDAERVLELLDPTPAPEIRALEAEADFRDLDKDGLQDGC